MRKHLAIALGLLLSTTVRTAAQTSTSRSELDGRALILQSLQAISANTSVDDVVLTGTASWHFGSHKYTADARLALRGTQQSRLDLNAGSLHSELSYGAFQKEKVQITNEDGIVHTAAPHNSQMPTSLLFPALLFQALLEPHGTIQFLGDETLGERSVKHLRYFHRYVSPNEHFAEAMQKMSICNLYLDANSHLLLKLSFALHPDSNALQDIPVEIYFADYRKTDDLLVPYHIERVVQGMSNLDFSIQEVVLNSGLPADTQ